MGRWRNTVVFLLMVCLIAASGCSIEIFSEFYVVKVTPEENTPIGTNRQCIDILFSKPVDKKGVEECIRIESDSSGEISFSSTVNRDRLTITPHRPWEPYQRFLLILSGDLQDIYGKQLAQEFYHCFQSTPGLIPVSAVLAEPSVKNGVVASETDHIQIIFSSDVDKTSTERAFSLSPEVDGYFEWISCSSFLYRLAEEMKKNNLYTVNISDAAVDISGFGIKAFHKQFEYFPNLDPLEITGVFFDSTQVFNSDDQAVNSGALLVNYQLAEKDAAVKVDFSSPVNKSTLKQVIHIDPYTQWDHQWIMDSSVVLLFKEMLDINRHYRLTINQGVEDVYGSLLPYDCILEFYVGGPWSRFIECSIADFGKIDTDASDFELWSNGAKIAGGIKSVNVEHPDQNNGQGYALNIIYQETAISLDEVPDIEVRWSPSIEFTNPSYIPVIDKSSFQDSINLALVFGSTSLPGGIYSFEWNTDCACTVSFRDMGAGNVYKLRIEGGKQGVIDDRWNYLEEDIQHYFFVKLTPG